VQRPDGSYLYEYDRDSGAESPGYNAVRHAGVTMSLYLLAAAGDRDALAPADRAQGYMDAHMVRRDGWAAFQSAQTGEAELGASALMLAGLAQRRLATADERYDTLMREAGRFLLLMQRPDGSFLDTWRAVTGAPDPTSTSRYATGEAFWALALLHRAFPGEGWDRPARLVADYLSLRRDAAEHFKFPPWADQWAAYGLAEMADWPLNDANIAYAKTLAARFGFLVRVEAQRRDSRFSKLLQGRQARAAGLGTWVEGLASLWRLAQADPRMGDLGPKIGERAVCSAGMLAARQVRTPGATLDGVDVIRGAWFSEGKTRMDDQQHALSGLLRTEAILKAGGR
jgi:hypothetical protein